MPKKVWKNVFVGRTPEGKPLFERKKVTVLKKGETPLPPEPVEENLDLPQPEGNIRDLEVEKPFLSPKFTPPTFASKVSEALDEKQDNIPERKSSSVEKES
jgi:hypothetical protein